MSAVLTIQSRSHPYTVEACADLGVAVRAALGPGTFWLVDQAVLNHYRTHFDGVDAERILPIVATEEQKSYEALTPVFAWLIRNGLRRDGRLVVVGGGVLQDMGCFIASVLFRGIRWELIPTTLLAQCDSCIGSKSSINIQSYKNQIGTFYPPHRVLLTASVLASLPADEIRSGMGEAIKLHLLTSDAAFGALMSTLSQGAPDAAALNQIVLDSLRIKQAYIEKDEFDRGVRNLLNYGHTFGHAYESATHYAIPHGISVILGMLTATFISARLGWIDPAYYQQLKRQLRPWHEPYGEKLRPAALSEILAAIKLDKKNTQASINCILTRGGGRMEKTSIDPESQLIPALTDFIAHEI